VNARLRDISRDLQSKLKEFFDSSLGSDATPLELLQATLDELERKVHPAGRGRRIFPYNRVVVHVAHRGADPLAIEAVFRELPVRLRTRLLELQCDAPEPIEASVAISDPPEGRTTPSLAIECFNDREARPEPVVRTVGYPSVTISIAKGQCAETEYVFEEPVIAIGRGAEPADALGQIRHNHVPFLEQRDGVNETVGRAHARLQFDSMSGHYHLFNESSSNPTSIIRGGRAVRVAPRDPRGVRVQSGDQIQLGRAVVRVTIAPSAVE